MHNTQEEYILQMSIKTVIPWFRIIMLVPKLAFLHPSKVQFPGDLKCSSDIQLRTTFFIYVLHISSNDSYGFTECLYIHKLSAKQSKPIAIRMLLNGNSNGVTKG